MPVPLLRPGRIVVLVLLLLLAGWMSATFVAAADAAPAPNPTLPVVNPPTSVAVLGDSISVGNGTQAIGSDSPENSWATGSNGSVNSVWNRMLELRPTATRQNLAVSGNRMVHLWGQAASLSPTTRLVLIQMGGNDICQSSSVATMTAVTTYRQQFALAMDVIESEAPNAMVVVSSLPDVWNLWFLRGAENPPNPQPSNHRTGVTGSYVIWDVAGICQTLLASPTSLSEANVQRRTDVRERAISYFTEAILPECHARLRCLTDDFETFRISSNRDSLWGDVLPPAEWGFVDNDISTLDHFHPSIAGQAKLARASWENGPDYDEQDPPGLASRSTTPSPRGGVNWTPAEVTFTWDDPDGVRGAEYRLHRDGTAGPWQTIPAEPEAIPDWGEPWVWATRFRAPVPVEEEGETWIEIRALDANGNLTASRTQRVEYDPAAIPAPVIRSGPAGPTGTADAEFNFSGIPSGISDASYRCSLDGGEFTECESPLTVNDLEDGPHSLAVRMIRLGYTGETAEAAWTVDTVAPDAPVLGSLPPALTNQDEVTITFTGESGASFHCSLDGAAFTACGSPATFTADGNREYSLDVRQTDAAGNTGPVARVRWVHDDIAPPPPVLTGAPAGPTNDPTVEFTFTGSGGTFQCEAGEAQTFIACTSPQTVTVTRDGMHSFQVREVDEAGNVGEVAQAVWVYDSTPPSPPVIETSLGGTINSTDASVAFEGGAGVTFECRFDGGEWEACTSPWTAEGLAEGDHTLEIRPVSEAGTAGAVVTVSWTVNTSPAKVLPPKLKPKPKLKVKGKVRKGKPVRYVIVTRFVQARGRPATLEFSFRKKKPNRNAKAAKKRTRKWKQRIQVRNRKQPRWVRVSDRAGNRSGWVRLRRK